jgi:hypothetical protein
MLNIPTTTIMKKALTRVREMSRARFTQADIDRISKSAAKSGVPIKAEFVAPDGSKIIITAGNGPASGDGDLDKWLRDHNARSAEGH